MPSHGLNPAYQRSKMSLFSSVHIVLELTDRVCEIPINCISIQNEPSNPLQLLPNRDKSTLPEKF